MIKAFVPYMAPSLNSIYSGVHWSERQKQANAGHWVCKALLLEPIDYPVKLTFIPIVGKGGRVRDCSNYSYAAKIIEDGLVQSGVLQDDSPKYVKGFSIAAPVVDRKSPSGFQIIIEKAEEVDL